MLDSAESTGTTETVVSTGIPVQENTQASNNISETHETSHQETEQTQSTESRPEGFDKVEFTGEQLQRVNRIYGNMKRYENDAKEQRSLNEQLVQEFQRLQQQQGQIINHLQVSDFSDAESRLNSERDAAWQKGDVKAFNEASDKLTEIKVKKAVSESQRQQQPQRQQVQQPIQQRPLSIHESINQAVAKGEIDTDEGNVWKAWVSETDQSGNLKRPWTSGDDMRNQAAVLEGKAVMENPNYATKPLAEKLREIDRRMGLVNQQTNGQSVLGAGNLTKGGKTSNLNNIKLDPKIEDIAVKLKFAGKDPKLTAQDHISAWKKAAVKSKGAR